MNKKSNLDLESIAKWGLGGAAGGAGLSALYHYIRDYKRLQEEETDSSSDDDVLYIQGKKREAGEKAASTPIDNSGVGKFLKLTAGAGGLVAGYKGVAKLYDIIREKSLQKELDNAQFAYVDALESKREKENKKYASINKEAILSDTKAGIYTSMLLLALASGVVSYKTLDKSFPGRKDSDKVRGKNRPVGGRTIKSRRSEHFPEEIKVLDEQGQVTESIDTTSNPDADAIEGMIRTTSSDPKISKEAGFDDLIAAVADGRTNEIKENLQYGINHTFNTIKGASYKNPSPAKESFAIGLLARDPMFKEAFLPLFASEFREMSPHIFHSASVMNKEAQDVLCKVASSYAQAFRSERISADKKLVSILKNASTQEKQAAAFLGGPLALEEVLDEGTSFFSQGEDSDDDEEESEEEPEEAVEEDELDSFFESSITGDYKKEKQ